MQNENRRDRWTMFPDLSDQIALVTGGGRGIGRMIAHALADAGAHVIVTSRTGSNIETVVGEIATAGGSASAIRADIASEAEVSHLFEQIRERWGRLDVLIANAAVVTVGPFADLDVADFDEMVAVNLRGTFLCCQQAIKMMTPQRSGYIIALSSVAGFTTYRDQSVYAATKHGLMGMIKGLALEAQEYDIRVSAILPGGVDTDMARIGRPDLDTSVLLRPEDIAKSVLFLLGLGEKAAIDQIYIRRKTSKPFP